MATGDDMVEFTIKNNMVSSEAIRRFKRNIPIHELKVLSTALDSKKLLFSSVESTRTDHGRSKSIDEGSCS